MGRSSLDAGFDLPALGLFGLYADAHAQIVFFGLDVEVVEVQVIPFHKLFTPPQIRVKVGCGDRLVRMVEPLVTIFAKLGKFAKDTLPRLVGGWFCILRTQSALYKPRPAGAIR